MVFLNTKNVKFQTLSPRSLCRTIHEPDTDRSFCIRILLQLKILLIPIKLHLNIPQPKFPHQLTKKVVKMAGGGERYNIHSQLEHLQSKYIGTGHADTSKHEWLSNQHRDTYSSILGRFDLLNLVAICENECKARIRFNLVEKMLQPCGPPLEKPED